MFPCAWHGEIVTASLLLSLAGSLRSLFSFFGFVWLVFDCEFASVGVCFDHAPRNMDESETCEGHSCSLVEICEASITTGEDFGPLLYYRG